MRQWRLPRFLRKLVVNYMSEMGIVFSEDCGNSERREVQYGFQE